jgi:hypothetical protein
MVRYAAPHELGFNFCRKMLHETRADMVYLNSLFDRAFSMQPLLALGRGRGIPILLTPRGELSPGALGLKAWRKRFFLTAARATGAYKRINWHASSKPEATQIKTHFSPRLNQVSLASNLPEAEQISINRPNKKQPGKLRIVLAARIAPMKNTHASIRMACQLPGEVVLDLWGRLRTRITGRSASERLH